jgi:hypothetical protein
MNPRLRKGTEEEGGKSVPSILNSIVVFDGNRTSGVDDRSHHKSFRRYGLATIADGDVGYGYTHINLTFELK